MRTAAVVVTHNRLELLQQCVSALLNQSVTCDILIIDNASDDGTADWASGLRHEQVHYLPTGANLGGAGGFQHGMRCAVEKGYECIWVMDDDCIPDPDALEQLLKADELLGGQYGFLASLPLWKDGKVCRMNRPKLHRSVYGHLHMLEHSLLRIEQATFVSCLFRSETVYCAGLPIKEFFIWGDDVEYTRRLAVRMKLPCFLVGASTVVHHMSSNNGSAIATDGIDRLPRYLLAYRNEHYLYRQEGCKGFLYYLLRCFLHSARVVAKATDHRMRRLGVIWKGFCSGFSFRPQVEYMKNDPCFEKTDAKSGLFGGK